MARVGKGASRPAPCGGWPIYQAIGQGLCLRISTIILLSKKLTKNEVTETKETPIRYHLSVTLPLAF